MLVQVAAVALFTEVRPAKMGASVHCPLGTAETSADAGDSAQFTARTT